VVAGPFALPGPGSAFALAQAGVVALCADLQFLGLQFLGLRRARTVAG
jgi:hypothetical protein